jgi:hypothetical protein
MVPAAHERGSPTLQYSNTPGEHGYHHEYETFSEQPTDVGAPARDGRSPGFTQRPVWRERPAVTERSKSASPRPSDAAPSTPAHTAETL